MGKGKGRSGHYNNYRAFCLVLYDKYKWEPDEIAECVAAADELWDRAAREGWDIKANCAECTGIDVTHFRDSGRINKLEVQDGEEG